MEDISESERKKHKEKFDECAYEIRSYLASMRITPKIYKYPTMIASRIFIIDDSEYIFGWFPLLNHNPEYVCCHLSRKGLSRNDIPKLA